jgi:hypothetical protein
MEISRTSIVYTHRIVLKKTVLRIRDPGSGAFLTPGSGMVRKSASGSGFRDEQPGSYFLELRNHFFGFLGLKYLNSLMRIRDPGWKKVGSGIRDKHPGSATVEENCGPCWSGIYLPLLGCIEAFDMLAEELMTSNTAEARQGVLRRAEDQWDKAQGQKMQKRAEIYVKVGGTRNMYIFV